MSWKNKKAFTVIEMSMVIIILSLFMATVILGGSKLSYQAKIVTARSLTKNSPVRNIADLALWLETTSKNSFDIYQPQDGYKVSIWNDINSQLTFVNNATQPVSNNQPVYKQNSIGGLPAIKFDELTTSYIKSTLNIDYTVMPNLTTFTVYKNNSGGNANQALYGQDNGSFDRFALLKHSSVNSGISNGSSVSPVTALDNRDVAQILTVILRNGVTNGSIAYVNGIASSSFTETHNNSGDSDLTIGGIGSAFIGYGKVDIGEFIVFSRALYDYERQEVEQYLSKKWGIKLG